MLSRVDAWIPSPVDEVIALHMFFERAQIAKTVTTFVEYASAQFRFRHRDARFCFPRHLQRRQSPVRRARYSAADLILGLMALRAACADCTAIIGAAHDKELMTMPVVRLPRIVGHRVAIDAPRMQQHIRHGRKEIAARCLFRGSSCICGMQIRYCGAGDQRTGDNRSTAAVHREFHGVYLCVMNAGGAFNGQLHALIRAAATDVGHCLRDFHVGGFRDGIE